MLPVPAGGLQVGLAPPSTLRRKSGQLVKTFNAGGSAALEKAIQKLGPMMYWGGKGELITRTEYMRWKYRNNKEDKINVDESGMTQFDPLLKWEVSWCLWWILRTIGPSGRCSSAALLGKLSSTSSSSAIGSSFLLSPLPPQPDPH